ncbi:1-deoxy-D-xylulose-5-phosphate reductoisomerase [Treponema pectinovorum]|uniref:1-deoxy-D-xylulose-5-phosphate reductoisomerase n=1 Tax=Treponema pectinovorum TaxID=164 RepID=UPI0011F2B8E2|nr:1-deoxy-D-xylulose-5-phosphate reductoisomerase [Treponema pectinovorum]
MSNEKFKKRILVLGCTGSIGSSTLDIIKNQPEKFLCCGLSANSNSKKLDELSLLFNCPSTLTSKDGYDGIKKLLEETKPDIVVNGISGSAGLTPTILTLERGINLALANKESVVMAGPLIFDLAKKNSCKILPVDSEHSAIFTLLEQCKLENVEKLIITASGGPFRTWKSEKIANATLKDALKHPTWNMGTKITVDSATLGNKGLEVIEAKRLFSFSTDDIQVVVHPESIIHSLVRTKDGIVYAQMSEPDMKHPIIQALNWPKVENNFMKPFDLTDTKDGKRTLTFEKPRTNDFPLLDLAFQAAKKDNCHPIAFNAANEIAAWAFIDEKIKFSEIAETVEHVMSKENLWNKVVRDLKDIFEADELARKFAKEFLKV